MPRITDLSLVSALLSRDRAWAAYAIGDLSPGLVEHCEWHASADASGELVLLYRGFDPPIAFAMGDPRRLAALFHEVQAPTISLHLRPGTVDAISGVYAPVYTRQMRRMVLWPADFRPAPERDVKPIGEQDLAAVSALYEDGHRTGQGPTFFDAAMLRQNTFRGLWEDNALVAIAGTHLYSTDLGICAIGNVYTRHDRRGRGLAARVTSAVVSHTVAQGVSTIVLNVSHANDTARRVYERLGFTTYCDFVEGEATRIPTI